MKHLLFFILACALLPATAKGQCTSSQERPLWIDGYFMELENSYIEVVSANGYDEDNARNKAAAIAVERRSKSTGARLQVSVHNDIIEVNGEDELTVKSRVIDEYREHCGAGEYRVSLLIQTAKNPTLPFDGLVLTKDYGFSSRAFVPGMAQLHKGSKTKGIAFIAGEVSLIGGIVVAESLRSSYTSKINTTHDSYDRRNYINNADNWQNIRNGFIAGVALVYAWNVIDGVVAKGKKHVDILGNNSIRITPYATPNVGGLTLAFNF